VRLFPLKLRRRPLVRIRRAGPASWSLCGGCGVASDVAYEDLEELSVAAILHERHCPVRAALWRDLVDAPLDENGRRRRHRSGRWRKREAA
jgi:hypothetical protein